MKKLVTLIRQPAVRWGMASGILLALFGMFIGGVAGTRGAVIFGLGGLVVGFLAGSLLKRIDKLPPRKEIYQSRGNYIGGNKMPEIEDILGDKLRK